MAETRILIPNCLNRSPLAAEKMVSRTISQADQTPLILDMKQVEFVKPYGALLLLAATRYVTENTGHKVRLENLRDNVLAYLERMDLFIEGKEWIVCKDMPDVKLSRNPASSHLLEITRLSTIGARTQFQSRARKVLNTWLPSKLEDINEIVTVLSEICGNAEEHSQDQGHVMIQSYRHQFHTEVDIVVIDLGIGISGSLSPRYQHIANSDIDYIKLALDGYSARGKQEGGAGLQIVQKHVANRNGELAIRSGSGLVVIGDRGKYRYFKIQDFPGTQVSLKLKGY
jgi:anti-sigma regulatory factor (Ser/Thr protein kinase)